MAQRDRKLTTNERLDSIINGPEDEVDDNVDYMQQEKKAKAFIQRARLYGCGARAKIPKIQKTKKKKKHPFMIDLRIPPTATDNKECEDSAVPPGSHGDAYRMVYNSKNDPFYTTTSMTEGIRTMNQPPWYFGANNKIVPSDSTMLNAATRYGYRGARNIQTFNTPSYDSAIRTRTAYTPAFLKGGMDPHNEWVPPIVGSPIQTINNLESPKLWPENTRFAFGMSMHQKSASKIYNRETTVGGCLPATSKSLQRVIAREEEETDKLKNYTRLESSRLLFSPPMASQLRFETSWRDRVTKTANGTLRATLSREIVPCQKHGLLDESDTLSSSLGGSVSIIVHTQSSQEIQYRYRLQQQQSTTPLAKRWRLIQRTLLIMRNVLRRDQSLRGAYDEMAKMLQLQTRKVASGSMINKANFLAAFRMSKLFEGIPEKQLSQMFSVFDHNKKNLVRYASMLSSFYILDQPSSEGGQLHRIAQMWDLYAEHSADLPPIRISLAVLTAASVNDEEFTIIKTLFEKDFEPGCFQLGLTNDYREAVARGNSALQRNFSPANKQQNDYDYYLNVFDQTLINEIDVPYISDLPVYSICGSRGLTREIFVAVLVSCDELLLRASEQYRARYLDLMAVEDAL